MTTFAFVCLGGYLVASYLDWKALTTLRARALPRPQTPGDRRCPFCHTSLDETGVVVCSVCWTEHHGECWSAHGRCSVFGCASQQPPRRKRARLPVIGASSGAAAPAGLAAAAVLEPAAVGAAATAPAEATPPAEPAAPAQPAPAAAPVLATSGGAA